MSHSRPHNGWWKAYSASRRWLDQLRQAPLSGVDLDGRYGSSSRNASAVQRLHVLKGRLQPV